MACSSFGQEKNSNFSAVSALSEPAPDPDPRIAAVNDPLISSLCSLG
jgi:hypothetical protein